MNDAPVDSVALHRYFQRDRFARLVGLEVLEIAPGYARVRMPLREDLHNGLGIAHGGAIFTLADMAFAVASNSHGTVAVGVNTSMSFLAAASTGTLTAEAVEVSRGRKLATYTVRITDEAGAVIAIMQGTVYRKDQPLELDTPGS
ncbi:MAG TPA: hydroxyphenylacetyl-CoA thioesterase PaaI [Phycisphaerae bacterium]|jgi:acyl-CoA thioesterase|nr:hydroxyphenylacetyl-CoA thioesterase PaaI [Phycisphaerae bacterium]HOB76454.1 hydroxyphenylacetyl-CoA thioesterase PaaI [Phycisphaerae bacterium]HOJ55373.1 hydroxyphenylacetyl-CoA thioesterase PaaI [Phycisphaerae bacterium]HOL25126.1 hydroxyphenylacetyl-CoA thioesterase PaaI [Phycisphaerae bacterium]HPP19698.1 hydroxyphenylacetyl-CoA thioesterase PaaI [Phycisphaerae bacterium]